MSNLKEFRVKINTIKSTRKVTSAMKLVAGVKLKKAEQQTFTSRRYADSLKNIISGISSKSIDDAPELFVGRGIVKSVLLIVLSSQRGLCGSFNANIAKFVRNYVSHKSDEKLDLTILCTGKKVFENLRHTLPEFKIEFFEISAKQDSSFSVASDLSKIAIDKFCNEVVDKVEIVYTKYHSPLLKSVECTELIPCCKKAEKDSTNSTLSSITLFEPDQTKIFEKLLPLYIENSLYQALLENFASEQGARMMAMDSATRSADEIISRLTIKYNRTRQSMITQELVEVVSGAEALNEG